MPTTRSLSLVVTEETTTRDPLYNGTFVEEKMAVVARVAPTFIRFGSFERFYYQCAYSQCDDYSFYLRNRPDLVETLANYTVYHHFPHLLSVPKPERYRRFFLEVVERTAKMIATWQSLGFTHGVMVHFLSHTGED